jgi:drug/metabolite transporter (DMT)-like permease
LDNTTAAVLLALGSTLGYGAAFALTRVALNWMPPRLGAAFSVPTSTLLFWCLAPFSIDMTKADLGAATLFACVGLFFPAAVTLLNFESSRLLGPNIAGAMSGLAPLFAVLLALILLHETLRPLQLFGLAGIVGGVMLMYRGRRQAFPSWLQSLFFLLPLAAAVIRGGVQPIIKLGLERWPSPLAAVVIGYTVSSAVLIGSALARDRQAAGSINRRGVLWFAAVGLCNGSAVYLTYAALGRGPVTLVAPLIASYPLITLVLSAAFLKEERLTPQLMTAIAVTVAGLIVLIVT